MMPKSLYLTTVVFFLSFFFSFLMSLNGSQPNLGSYWLMTAIWKIWSELPRALTTTGWAKSRFWDRLWTLTEHLCNRTWHQQSERSLSIYRDSLHAPKFGEFWSINGWEGLASFCQSPKFSNWENCQPYRMDVI